MASERDDLLKSLESHYRTNGWPVRREQDGTVAASGPGGVTWLGAAVVRSDIEAGDLEERLVDLAARRMPGGGELCPLDLLPAEECEAELRGILDRIGLSRRPHVSVYSRAA